MLDLSNLQRRNIWDEIAIQRLCWCGAMVRQRHCKRTPRWIRWKSKSCCFLLGGPVLRVRQTFAGGGSECGPDADANADTKWQVPRHSVTPSAPPLPRPPPPCCTPPPILSLVQTKTLTQPWSEGSPAARHMGWPHLARLTDQGPPAPTYANVEYMNA